MYMCLQILCRCACVQCDMIVPYDDTNQYKMYSAIIHAGPRATWYIYIRLRITFRHAKSSALLLGSLGSLGCLGCLGCGNPGGLIGLGHQRG